MHLRLETRDLGLVQGSPSRHPFPTTPPFSVASHPLLTCGTHKTVQSGRLGRLYSICLHRVIFSRPLFGCAMHEKTMRFGYSFVIPATNPRARELRICFWKKTS